jgi:hypothetical protein
MFCVLFHRTLSAIGFPTNVDVLALRTSKSCQGNMVVITSSSSPARDRESRILIVALIAADKFLNDCAYASVYCANLLGMITKKVNKIESQYYTFIDYDLFRSVQDTRSDISILLILLVAAWLRSTNLSWPPKNMEASIVMPFTTSLVT